MSSSCPVSVSKGRVHLDEAAMEIDKFYLVGYKKRTLAIRKLSNGKIEVYGLPGQDIVKIRHPN